MYEEFDKLLVEAIQGGANNFASLESLLIKQARDLAGRGRSAYRVIDSRLQALKRRGLIRYFDRKWEVCK